MGTAIKVENLSKQYKLGLVNSTSIKDDLTKLWHQIKGGKNPFLNEGDVNTRATKGTSNYVWSLKDINFEVDQGDILGIVGKNGAGKSTLLKILSKITTPTTGTIKSKGKIASLLEVGTGFHPELTGKENIYLNGAILGMRRSEITRKLDEIIDFAGVERYINTPVKRYSSGMYVRLAFAVAAHLDPEILIVDEVLAVGDVEFQNKCLGRMKDVSHEGRTIILVSHNMVSVRSLCNRGILLEDGMITKTGTVNDVIGEYLMNNAAVEGASFLNSEQIKSMQTGFINKTNPTLEITKLELLNSQGKHASSFSSTEDIIVGVEVNVMERMADMRVVVELMDEHDESLLVSQVSDTNEYLNYQQAERIQEGEYRFECVIGKNILSTKKYFLTIHVINVKNEHYTLTKVLSFDVDFIGYNNVIYGAYETALFRPKFNWNYSRL